MSKGNTTKWVSERDTFVLAISHSVQAVVAPKNGMFEAMVYDEAASDVWRANFATKHGAQLASTAALKRLGYLKAAVAPVETVADQPEAEQIEVPETKLATPQSIWKPVVLRTSLVGKGIAVTCIVKVRENCAEAITKLGSYVFREEHPNEWAAKRAAHQWATMLIERHAGRQR